MQFKTLMIPSVGHKLMVRMLIFASYWLTMICTVVPPRSSSLTRARRALTTEAGEELLPKLDCKLVVCMPVC